ncbi:MAG TPA: AraC family transcriptional regulator [Chitinophagaceae bacterium]|nr:AraC family transcriptional regulator [Chitinophagaceae bacterium]
MPIQLNIFLLLFGGLQGALLTIFLARKKLHKPGYAFLLLYFGVLLLQIVLKVMSKGWLMGNWPLLYTLSYQLPFLYGPVIYLFAMRFTGSHPFRPSHLLHFLPFIVVTVLTLLALTSPVADQLMFVLFEGERRLAFQLISIGVYHYLAYRFQQHNASQSWFSRFIMFSMICTALVALTIYFMYLYFPALNWIRMGFLFLTVFIYWVSYAALTQPDMFSTIPTVPHMQVHRVAKKYNNSSLAGEEAARIVDLLERQMATSKPYLEPDLTIDRLANLAGTNRHHLSQVLNEKLGLSFYDYVNTYRVNEAKLLLTDPSRARHKIASIAYDAGFNSLSTFNDVFRKWTSQTPSAYRKQPINIPGSIGLVGDGA